MSIDIFKTMSYSVKEILRNIAGLYRQRASVETVNTYENDNPIESGQETYTD